MTGPASDSSEVLFIGGRSGVGKSTMALELHRLLVRQDIRHAVVEGDNLDLAHPAPWKHPTPWRQGLAEKNLSALWDNYRALGYRRLIYTNTVAVRETAGLAAAMGDSPQVHAVLLRSSDEPAGHRLGLRESGNSNSLGEHLRRSRKAAQSLDLHTPAWVHRVETDGRSAGDVAEEILALTGWARTPEVPTGPR